MRKSHGGAGKYHGTAASRESTPEAAAKRITAPPELDKPRDDETRGDSPGETACGKETPKGVLIREAEQSCEGNAKPMSVAGRNPGQAAITARIASPVRGCEESSHVTRAGGVSNKLIALIGNARR